MEKGGEQYGSPNELLQAHGVGQSKVEHYGTEIISIVGSFVSNEKVHSASNEFSSESDPDDFKAPTEARCILNGEQGLPSRAYAPWSREEDQELKAMYEKGNKIPDLGKHFERKVGAIRSRLAKLGILELRLR